MLTAFVLDKLDGAELGKKLPLRQLPQIFTPLRLYGAMWFVDK